jgi:hypothetical protein
MHGLTILYLLVISHHLQGIGLCCAMLRCAVKIRSTDYGLLSSVCGLRATPFGENFKFHTIPKRSSKFAILPEVDVNWCTNQQDRPTLIDSSPLFQNLHLKL